MHLVKHTVPNIISISLNASGSDQEMAAFKKTCLRRISMLLTLNVEALGLRSMHAIRSRGGSRLAIRRQRSGYHTKDLEIVSRRLQSEREKEVEFRVLKELTQQTRDNDSIHRVLRAIDQYKTGKSDLLFPTL